MEAPRTPRTPERALSADDNGEGADQAQHDSALWEALARELDDPTTLTDDLADQILGPTHIDGCAESSLYWVHEQESDKPCVLRFPALLDIGGKFGRTGTYFNQQNVRNRTQIPVKSLHKIRTIFELVKLPGEEQDLDGKPLYPPDAVKCSERMFNFLHICTHKLESERNKGSHERPVPHGFFRDYMDEKNQLSRSTFIVSSPPLFTEIEDASTVEDISDLEIQWDKQKMSDLLHDQTLTQTFSTKFKKGSTSQGGTDPELTLDSLHDPNGRYSTLKKEGYGSTKLIVPQVFDHNDELILPREYKSKFNDKTPVVVDIELRVWEFLPRSSGTLGSPIKQRIQANRHGSRRYQLMLKSMKLLTPDAPDSPRKRKLDRGTLDQWRSPRAPDSPSPSESPSKRARR